MSDDDDIFDFDEGMDTDAQPITIDSDDSFEEGPARTSFVSAKTIVERYQNLKEESKQLDEMAKEVRSLLLICKQMEECYCKRVNQKILGAASAEIRHLHDGTALLLVTIHNITDQIMSDWTLSINPSPIFSYHGASCSQSIPLGTLRPGIRKTFECHVAREFCEPPMLLQMALIREFQLEEVRKVFQVDVDPLCVTIWDQAQIVKEKSINASFTSTIRLPHPLIDLLSGCPDTIPSPLNVFKTALNLTVEPDVSEVIVCIPFPDKPDILAKVSIAKDGATHHSLTIGTEGSRSHELLAEHLRLRLIVEMSKLKSRPTKGISVVAEMDAASVEELFQSMLAAFH